MKSQTFFGKQKKRKTVWPFVLRRIHGHSMMPVLPPGTYIWATRWYRRLHVGDIVIFKHSNKEKIKRIHEIRNNELFVVGDHSAASTDSRQFGWIMNDTVQAKLLWPHAPKSRAENSGPNNQISPER